MLHYRKLSLNRRERVLLHYRKLSLNRRERVLLHYRKLSLNRKSVLMSLCTGCELSLNRKSVLMSLCTGCDHEEDPGLFWVIEADAVHQALTLNGAPVQQGTCTCTCSCM